MTSMVYFEIDNTRYEFVPPERMTFAELREAKLISGGMSATVLEHGLVEADPDAWLAVLTVSAHRSDHKIDPDIFLDMDFLPMIEAIGRAAQEAAAENPPEPSSTDGE